MKKNCMPIQNSSCGKNLSKEEIEKMTPEEFKKLKFEEIEFFKNPKNFKSFSEVISHAATCRDKNNRKFPHQYRIPNNLLKELCQALKAKEKNILKIQEFSALYNFIEETKRNFANKGKGIGELTIYDVALRIALYRSNELKNKILPQEVYIHAGARTGAEKVLKRCCKKTEPISAFPSEIQKIGQAYKIEAYLCIIGAKK